MVIGRSPRTFAPTCLAVSWLLTTPALAAVQTPAPPDASARRIGGRLRALEDEADRLAAQARDAVTAIEAAESERDRLQTLVARTVAARRGINADLALLRERMAALRQADAMDEPLIAARLVELYKQGRGSYLRLLLGAESLQDMGRAAGAGASLVDENAARVTERLDAIRAAAEEERALQARVAEAEDAIATARADLDAAQAQVEAREAAATEIDRLRDTNARLLGALRAAQPGAPDAPPRAAPFAAFRGALNWPVVGPVATRFRTGRRAPAATASGITISAPPGTPVVAVHGGTVTFAEPFAGLGTMVLLDHGSGFNTAYGLLRSTSAQRDQWVAEGQELGVLAEAPGSGTSGLYFEIRANGQPTDPLQWLRPR